MKVKNILEPTSQDGLNNNIHILLKTYVKVGL